MSYNIRMNNYCILRVEKAKSKQDVTNLLKEQHRAPDYESKRADPALAYLNSYSGDYESAQARFNELLPEKIRKNAVLGLNFLVSTSKQLEAEEERAFYEKARQYIGEHFGEVVGWAIHRDEFSTHMQVLTIPLVDGKLNARALIGGSKNELRNLQTDFHKKVGKDFGLARGQENTRTRHKTVEEYHKEQAKELEREKNALEKDREKLRVQQNQMTEERVVLGLQRDRLEADKKDLEAKSSAAIAAAQAVSKFEPDEPEKIFKRPVEAKTPENIKKQWKKKLFESHEKYAHRVVTDVMTWFRKITKPFEEKYNSLRKKVHDTSYALYNEQETSRRLRDELKIYDYRNKTPEELEKIAEKKRSQTREKSRNNVKMDWGR